jgi:hypothetical protein
MYLFANSSCGWTNIEKTGALKTARVPVRRHWDDIETGEQT